MRESAVTRRPHTGGLPVLFAVYFCVRFVTHSGKPRPATSAPGSRRSSRSARPVARWCAGDGLPARCGPRSRAGAALAAILVVALAPHWVGAAPFVPADDSVVVEHLRERPLERTDLEFRQLRARLRVAPSNLPLALAVARRSIDIAHRDGDPRYLGYAQAALATWWAQPAPPPAVQLVRASILQSTHQFPAALADLAAVVRVEPRNAQAWLTQATVLQVQGRYDEAAASCRALPALGAAPYAEACLAELASLTGHAAEATARLARLEASAALSRAGASSGWLWIIEAELAERLGHFSEAERYYRLTLNTSPDAYAKAAFADFLLDRGRAAEVVQLLEREQRADPLLLRLALAYRASGDLATAATVAALAARFDAARLRGDVVHRREEARFRLQLRDEPAKALELALANWEVQKEPADARIALEAARAAGRSHDADRVREFIRTHGWADQRLESLL